MTMKSMGSVWLSLGLVVLATAACPYPPLPDPSDGDDTPLLALNLELLAGSIGGRGNVDGAGSEARFNIPTGVAVNSYGNVYVADTSNHTIRKVTAAGVVTTLAGTAGTSGSADGTGAAARFFSPTGVAVDSDGNVYVADTSNHTIRKVTATGVVTTLAGVPGTSGNTDGIGAAARFSSPAGVAVDSIGNIYVADRDNHTIRRVTAVGVVTTLAGTAGAPGSTDGTGAAAHFFTPSGIAVDSAGDVYVADTPNHTIRKVTAAGVATTLAGTAGTSGSTDGTGAAARFFFPTGVVVDSAGYVYVADRYNRTIRKIIAAGVVTTLAGTAGLPGSTDDIGARARFDNPTGVAVDSAGNVYVADAVSSTIRKVTAAGTVTTFAGTAGTSVSTDGTGVAARFHSPTGVAVDRAGNVYVADEDDHTIRKVTAAGVVTTLAGIADTSGSADGMGPVARFFFPAGVAVDSAGNIYVADRNNHTIRKITAAGVVTTLAGTAGTSGSADGTGAEARFFFPTGVAVDSIGNIYVADRNNHTIRKVTAAGVVTTLAGTVSVSGNTDGMGGAARFFFPTGVAVDSIGNIYVADRDNHTIRKVTATGVVTTLAGTAVTSGSADGTGTEARFFFPTSVTIDSIGNIYVADRDNHTIRQITAPGTTTTIAGMVGVAGIFLGATPRVAFPASLATIGDSIVISTGCAILLLRHGALRRP